MSEPSILDYEEEKILLTYGKKSMIYLFYSLILFPFSYLLFSTGNFPFLEYIYIPEGVLMVAMMGIWGMSFIAFIYFSLGGVWAAIKSFFHREEDSINRWSGLLGNGLVFYCWLSVIIDILLGTGLSLGLAEWMAWYFDFI